ncbi:resolvase [Thermocladium modestius]|uniref:Resolvase n=1 Tax=Thermocladium modestius TaxID=62609 RepID=A0A830GU84_9CREN|nr:recombinase family protein [Thermocladium modestius]GGP20288.1 resolvase [Thermocladium modestius]
MIPAISYIRVSTEEQDPENQRVYLEKWASERGFTIVKHYVDFAVSGSTSVMDRPAFHSMVSEAPSLNPRPIALLVYEVSRLVRNFQEFFRLLDIVENRMGLLIVSTSEKESVLQNLDGAYRQFLRTVLAFVANMERDFIRQRTKAAMDRLRAEGKIRSKLESIPPEVMESVVRMYGEGLSMREVAKRSGVSVYMVRRILGGNGYRPGPYTCPRCFGKMRITDRSLKQLDGKYAVVERLYCPRCGYEETKVL